MKNESLNRGKSVEFFEWKLRWGIEKKGNLCPHYPRALTKDDKQKIEQLWQEFTRKPDLERAEKFNKAFSECLAERLSGKKSRQKKIVPKMVLVSLESQDDPATEFMRIADHPSKGKVEEFLNKWGHPDPSCPRLFTVSGIIRAARQFRDHVKLWGMLQNRRKYKEQDILEHFKKMSEEGTLFLNLKKPLDQLHRLSREVDKRLSGHRSGLPGGPLGMKIKKLRKAALSSGHRSSRKKGEPGVRGVYDDIPSLLLDLPSDFVSPLREPKDPCSSIEVAKWYGGYVLDHVYRLLIVHHKFTDKGRPLQKFFVLSLLDALYVRAYFNVVSGLLRKCAREGCTIFFVPRHTKKYCSDRCRYLNSKQRRKTKGRKRSSGRAH